MNKVLILGASGMVGSKFVETYGRDFEFLIPDEREVDLTDAESIKKFIDSHQGIDSIVNFAAYTNVSEAQKQKGDREAVCWRINVNGAENLAEAINDKDIFLVQISTDMVFPGDEADSGPYEEKYQVTFDENRLTWYGYTKAMAEKILSEKVTKLAVLRIIYPVTKEYGLKMDYLRAPLDYYNKNEKLYPIFEDQQMNISDIDEINLAIKVLLEKRLSGVFHAGASDVSTPYKIVKQLFELKWGNSEMVVAGNLKEFLKTANDPVRYPMFGGLSNTETKQKLGVRFSSCSEIVERLYKD